MKERAESLIDGFWQFFRSMVFASKLSPDIVFWSKVHPYGDGNFLA